MKIKARAVESQREVAFIFIFPANKQLCFGHVNGAYFRRKQRFKDINIRCQNKLYYH